MASVDDHLSHQPRQPFQLWAMSLVWNVDYALLNLFAFYAEC